MRKLTVALTLTFITLVFTSSQVKAFEAAPVPDLTFITDIVKSLNYNNDKELVDARRGGGGRRGGSIGGSRRSRSSGTNRSTRTTRTQTDPKKTPSFGGNRMTQAQATKKYGTPRKTETMVGKNAAGQNVSYSVNRYGGYGSGLMTGYMMGSVPFMWSMPFHPAFYYSRPTYVTNPDGTIAVYPPTFSFGKLLFTLLIIAAIIFIIRRIIKARRSRADSQSSFG